MTRSTCRVVLFLTVLSAACSSRPRRIILGVGVTAGSRPGIVLAVKEINAAGGIKGLPLEIIGLDWMDSPGDFNLPSVLEWAKKFAETKELLAVIGHSDSASTLSAAAFYNEQKIPQLVTIATNPDITNIGDWTYRLCLSDATQGPVLAEYAVKDWGKRRIAMYYVNDEYGRGLAQLFERRARELGAEIVASVIHRNALLTDDKALIASTLETLKKNGPPDLVVLIQRVGAAIWTVRAIRDAGINADLLGSDNLAQSAFVGGSAGLTDGMRISQFYVPEGGNPRAERFVREYRAANGDEPDYSQAFAYDAVYLLRDAIVHGGYSRQAVKDYLDHLIRETTPVDGVAGRFTLGRDHDARRSLNIVEVRDGRMRHVKAITPE